MPIDQILTAVVTATVTFFFTILLPRLIDLVTGAQGRKRDALRQAWDDLEEAEKARRANARSYAEMAEYAIDLRRIITAHGGKGLIPPWPGQPGDHPEPMPTPTSLIQRPIHGPQDNP